MHKPHPVHMATADSADLSSAEASALEPSAESADSSSLVDSGRSPEGPRSLLDVLKPASKSDLSRKRKVRLPRREGLQQSIPLTLSKSHLQIVLRSSLESISRLGMESCFV